MYWHDGMVRAASTLPFDVRDRGLLLGDGVFDTSLVLNATVIWREAHLLRLDAACESLGFRFDRDTADQAIAALVTQVPNGILRLTVTRGPAPRGLTPPKHPMPAFLASLAPLRASPCLAPLSLGIATIRRNETSPTSRLKTLNYLDSVLAAQEAVAAGFDDALLLNTQDRVACATAGNIVMIRGSRLLTPPIADGVLPGLARCTLLSLARTIGLEPEERPLSLADLTAADMVFVTSSVKLMAPVTRIGTVRCAAGGGGRLVEALCASVRTECGVDPREL